MNNDDANQLPVRPLLRRHDLLRSNANNIRFYRSLIVGIYSLGTSVCDPAEILITDSLVK